MKEMPYKTYLEESEMPKAWYNVRADMKKKPAPLLNPKTLKPITKEELSSVFCEKLAEQEIDEDNAWFDIPDAVLDFYKMYRPAPLVRARFLEKALGTPAKIFYKFEGNNTSGSHKLNSAIAQLYYAKVSRALPQKPAQDNGVRPFRWPVLSSGWIPKCLWLNVHTNKNRFAEK